MIAIDQKKKEINLAFVTENMVESDRNTKFVLICFLCLFGKRSFRTNFFFKMSYKHKKKKYKFKLKKHEFLSKIHWKKANK